MDDHRLAVLSKVEASGACNIVSCDNDKQGQCCLMLVIIATSIDFDLQTSCVASVASHGSDGAVLPHTSPIDRETSKARG